MGEKYIIEFEDDADVSYIISRFGDYVKIKSISEKPTDEKKKVVVRKKRTGVLKSVYEITGNRDIKIIQSDNDVLCLETAFVGERMRINDYSFPESFYKKIKEEYDYSELPDGTVIRYGQYYKEIRNASFNVYDRVHGCTINVFLKNLGDIEIIKVPDGYEIVYES